MESIPGTLGASWEYSLDGTTVHHTHDMHMITHSFAPDHMTIHLLCLEDGRKSENPEETDSDVHNR